MGRVDEKIALITGAGRGMGRSHALRLAEEGADLILTDVCASVDPVRYSMASIEDLEETVSLAEKFGGRVASYVADVRDRAAMKAAVDAGVAELGGLDVIVANAGVIIEGTFDSFTEADVATTVDVNLIGVINTCLVGIPHLRERGGGSVICISSAAGIKGNPLTLPYTASKFGVTGVAMALARGCPGVHPGQQHPPHGRAHRDRCSRAARAPGEHALGSRCDLPERAAGRAGRARRRQPRGALPRQRRVALRHRPAVQGRRRRHHPLRHRLLPWRDPRHMLAISSII